MNIVLSGNLPTSLAAMGAAISPPAIKPATSAKGMFFKKMKKVMELASTTKNSARQTDPMTYLGLLLFEINVLVTRVPQPLPAKASRNPPILASQPALLTLL